MANHQQGHGQHRSGRNTQQQHHRGAQEGHPFYGNQYTEGYGRHARHEEDDRRGRRDNMQNQRGGQQRRNNDDDERRFYGSRGADDRRNDHGGHRGYDWNETGQSYINGDRDYNNDRRRISHDDDYLNSYSDRRDDHRREQPQRRNTQGDEFYSNQYSRGRRDDYADGQQYDDSRGLYGHNQEASFDGGRRRFGYDNTFRNYDTGYDANDNRGYGADDYTRYDHNRYDGNDGRRGHDWDERRGNRR